MSAEATRMQDLACEFSKIFRGNTPGPPQREGAIRTHPQPGLWPGAGRKRGAWTQTSGVFGPKPWSPSTFQPWLRPCLACYQIEK